MSHGLHARNGGVDYFSLALGDSKVYSHDFASECLGGWYIHNLRQRLNATLSNSLGIPLLINDFKAG